MKLYFASLSDFGAAEYEKYFSLMDAERRQAISRMRIENDKRRSVLGEALARRGVSELIGIAEEDIRFGRTENGKPNCLNANAFFSISHSQNTVVCAVDGCEVGADAEEMRDVEIRVLRFCCTERDMIDCFFGLGISEGDRSIPEEFKPAFFRLWTAKEAYSKYVGIGVSAMKNVNYSDIAPDCKFIEHGGCTVSVYSKREGFELIPTHVRWER